jgi:hypothetical protein
MEQNQAFGKTPIHGKIEQTEHPRSGLFSGPQTGKVREKSPDPFFALMRLYWPKAEAVEGKWKQPPLTRVK